MYLAARAQDDLNWVIEKTPSYFELDLGLDEPYFPLEDPARFNALKAGLEHFRKNVFPHHPVPKVILMRRSANFADHFLWTERMEENFKARLKTLPDLKREHALRLFCAESFVMYAQMLCHSLPDEISVELALDPTGVGSMAETLQLLSPDRFEHFEINALHFSSNVGVCFPPDEVCSKEVLERIDRLLHKLSSYRPVYESLLTEQWDGLDEIYVFEGNVTELGERKLLGFEAAGGKVIRGRGI